MFFGTTGEGRGASISVPLLLSLREMLEVPVCTLVGTCSVGAA